MRMLVTGASGFVGRHVVESLLRREHRVIVLGREWSERKEDVEFIRADLLGGSEAYLDRLIESRPDVLVHVAWYAKHGEYWNSPLNHDWIGASGRLVDAFRQAGGKRVLGVGTCAEYEWTNECCLESSTRLRPHTLYGLAKGVTRSLLAGMCSQHDVEFAWARVFFPFGSGESSERLVPSVVRALLGQRAPFRIDGEAVRDFLHVSDVGEALAELSSPGNCGEYNVCSGEPIRIKDVVGCLARCLGTDAGPLEQIFASRSGDPRILLGDSTRLRAIGWKPQFSLHEALAKVARELAPG